MISRGWPGRSESGFTVLEMLIVMIILAVLAAISIPTIISQRAKARDTATRTDTRRLGLEVGSWMRESSTPPTVTLVSDRFQVGGIDVGAASFGTVIAGGDPANVTTTGWTPSAWCLALTNPNGAVRTFKMSANNGLESGTCTSPTLP